MKPKVRQVIAIIELNRCWAKSSGIYWSGDFFKNNLAKRIIGLKLKNKPNRFAINGISKMNGSLKIKVNRALKKIVHWFVRTNGRGIERIVLI